MRRCPDHGTWVVGVAKAGVEEGVDSIGGSCIIAPSGEVVARCLTKGDEMVHISAHRGRRFKLIVDAISA